MIPAGISPDIPTKIPSWFPFCFMYLYYPEIVRKLFKDLSRSICRRFSRCFLRYSKRNFFEKYTHSTSTIRKSSRNFMRELLHDFSMNSFTNPTEGLPRSVSWYSSWIFFKNASRDFVRNSTTDLFRNCFRYFFRFFEWVLSVLYLLLPPFYA